MIETLRVALIAVAAGYVVLCAFYYLTQDRLIFQPTPPVAPGIAAVDIEFTAEGARLAGYLVNPDAFVNVFYFGGNAEAIALHARRFAAIERARTVLMEYRGYGRSTGKPSEAALIDDVVRYVSDLAAEHHGPVVFIGRSLGSGVAALAAARLQGRVDAMLLISPFCSLADVATWHMPAWLPVRLLLKHRFEVAAVSRALPERVRIVLATNDAIIPPPQSRCLASRLGQSPADIVELQGAGHNDVFGDERLWQAVEAVVEDAAARASRRASTTCRSPASPWSPWATRCRVYIRASRSDRNLPGLLMQARTETEA